MDFKTSLKKTFSIRGKTYYYYCLKELEKRGEAKVSSLPFSIKLLLESAIRNYDGKYITRQHCDLLMNWRGSQRMNKEIPFKPSRIILQDFTGIPALIDVAAMRNAVERNGGDVSRINPQIPVDLVIDHSVIVDDYGHKDSLDINHSREYERNEERYRFVRWAQKEFKNFRAIPPASGIVHQVNLEFLASSVMTSTCGDDEEVFPDSVVGTDSHTPMINGIGTIGWGVGGIEAEAAMLGQPLYFVIPEVLGVNLYGMLPEGTTATDLTLTITQVLRQKGVVGKYVEFFGEGLRYISLADRATIANMAPEYGATIGYFPVDQVTMDYLKLTGRGEIVPLAEVYFKEQELFYFEEGPTPEYSEVIEIDLSTIKPSLAGPKRPQDRVELAHMKQAFATSLSLPIVERGYGLNANELNKEVPLHALGEKLVTGAVVLASITSCTNTSNPFVMIGAGLLAKKAVEQGLKVPSYVKSSLTPGSKVVTKYLKEAGLLKYLEQLGFFVDGYGCATCCGNSGSLNIAVEKAIQKNNLVVSSVLSGNRNFEGRVHPLIKANYLGSPPLVVTYALAGNIQTDLTCEPVGYGWDQKPVYLKDIWPSSLEIEAVMRDTLHAELYREQYEGIDENEKWESINVPEGLLFEWDHKSTYIQEPPYFKERKAKLEEASRFVGLRALLVLGDSITTDHISPAGQIPLESPAGQMLSSKGVSVRDFNAYGSRRGNHYVMMRGTFANIRLQNQLANGKEGGYTTYLPTGEVMTVFDAAERYKKNNQSLIVIAGKEYGTGSSRDWAAKGTALLGVKAVLAESYERIHRSNLVGMGILPLEFQKGQGAKSHKLDGTETYDIDGIDGNIQPGQFVKVVASREDGNPREIMVKLRLDSDIEIEYYRNGGILQTVMKEILN